MKIAIIADDLTGANDSGVQFARRGLLTAVIFTMDARSVTDQDVIILNTDSRSIPREQAYERVTEAARFMHKFPTQLIYKKIDSALRGNIGTELDAIYDVFQPEFIIVAPAYPDNQRTTKEGIHYVNGVPVSETDFGADKKTPVTESHIPALLAQQTNKQVALITCTELRASKDAIVDKLQRLRSDGIPYVVSDAEFEADLLVLVQAVMQSGYRVVWAGSAGLAKCLPIRSSQSTPITYQKNIKPHTLPALIAVGSMTTRSHVQVQMLLSGQGAVSVELVSERLVAEPAEREREIHRACEHGVAAASNGQDVVVHVSIDDDEVARTIAVGQAKGKGIVAISESIADAIGEVVSYLLGADSWAGVVMTGGDTATHICNRLGITQFELIDEVEPGVPLGKLVGESSLYAVTKAGSFGTDDVLRKSVTRLKECSQL